MAALMLKLMIAMFAASAHGLASSPALLRARMGVPRYASPQRLPSIHRAVAPTPLRMVADIPAEEEVVAEEAAAPAEPEASPLMANFQKFSNLFSNLFPVWTLMVALMGLFTPGVFLGISTSYFTGLLGLLMLSMGITLTVDDFKRVLQRPGVMIAGFLGCYGLMPAMALGLSKLLGLPATMTAGMVLVGSINGGQASNLCTYIAKGDVALSVLMTTVTTLGAIVMTPLICKVLLGAIVPVDAVGVGAALSAIMCKLPRSCHAPLESPTLFSPIPPVSFVAPLHYRLLIC